MLERLLVFFFGFFSRSVTVFHLRLCQDNVGANGWCGWILSPFSVQRFFSSFPHWATYKNRLDAVLGVDRIVFRDKPVTKITLDLSLAGVDCAP